jgi:hypothetical protein
MKPVSQLFNHACALLKNKKLAGAWTRNGHLVVKTLESQGSKIIGIKSANSLAQFE